MKFYEAWIESNLKVISKSGLEWNCLCPFHEDRTPSFRVNIDKGLFYCHGCGKGGHLNSMMGSNQSAETLLSSAWIREKLADALTDGIPEASMRKYSPGTLHPYLSGRGFTQRSATEWELGYDVMRNAITIPVRSMTGQLRGVVKRFLDPDVKIRYRYPKGMKKSRQLFGSWMVESEVVFVVEGSLDAIACHQNGVEAVSILGSKVSDYQVQELKRLGCPNVVLFLDDDKAGDEGTEFSFEKLEPHVGDWILTLQVVPKSYYNGAKDPGEMNKIDLHRVARDFKA